MEWKIGNYQTCVFISMYLAYAGGAVNRRSVTYIMPAFMKSDGLEKSELGLISSSWMVAYTISKLISGILADQISPKLLLITGGMISAFAILIFPYGGIVPVYCALQFLNGFGLGALWPACAKLLRKWYTPSQLATYWGILSTSANLAGSIAPVIASFVILHLGWKLFLQSFGFLTGIMSVVCIFTIWNSPKDAGFEDFQNQIENIDDQKEKESPTKSTTSTTIEWIDLLKSPFILMLVIGYMLTGVIRASCNEWGQLLLIQQYGHSQYMASAFISSFETGGIASSFLAGVIADRLMKNRTSDIGSPRILVVIGGFLTSTVFLFIFASFSSSESTYVFVTFVGFMIGAGVYCLATLYGVIAIESAPTELSGTAHALVALGANVGGVLGGYPVTVMAKYIEWTGVFNLLFVASAAMTITTVVFKDLQSPVSACRDKAKKKTE